MKRIFQSLRARLNCWVLLVNLAIFGSIAIVFHVYSFDREEKSAIRYTRTRLDNMAMSIEQKIRDVEYSVRQAAPVIEAHLDDSNTLNAIVEQWVRRDSLVMGGSIAFEPNYYPSRGKWFMPYVFIDSTGIAIHKQLGGKHYDYFHKEWYTAAKASDSGTWSEPYFDEGGGQIYMVTYSYPLHDTHGNVYAVITADVSLHELTRTLRSLQPYEDSRTYMTTSRGTFISHWRKELECKANSKDYPADSLDSGDTMAFSTIMPKVGWRLCTFCTYKSVMGELLDTTLTIVAIFFVGLLILSFCIRLVLRREMMPLEHLAVAARKIGGGNFNVELPDINATNELRSLHDSFAAMQSSLTNYISELKSITASKQRIESELHVAHDLQMHMLPRVFPPFPERKEIDLYATIISAKEVGGDLYDFFVRNEKLFIAVGDVSGKGIPASLFMAITSRMFRMVAATTDSPATIASKLNNVIADDNDSCMFVTMFIGVVDLKSGNMTFCNVGHNPPLLLPDNGKSSFLSAMSNLPIGIVNDFDYKEQSINISHSKLIVYTDGVSEAEDSAKRLWGEDQLKKTCDRLKGESSKQITEGIVDGIKQHAGSAEQSDDITILCLALTLDNASRSMSISNDISELAQLSLFLDSFADDNDIDTQTKDSLNLALEEAIVNVINYAYPKGEKGKISLTAQRTGSILTFTITDSGKPFDPTKVPDADINAPIEAREEGGLGILLTRHLMNDIAYERKDDKNILTMTKNI